MGFANESAPGLLGPLAALACMLGLAVGQANAGLAIGVSLVVGLIVYGVLRTLLSRTRARFSNGRPIDASVLLASLEPDDKSRLEQSAIRLSDQLDATRAELAVFERRALRAEEQVREVLRLLEAVAEGVLPRVELIESHVQELLSQSSESFDRRGPLGRVAREVASIHTRLADLAALAEIDGADVRRRAIPSNLASLLEQAAESCPHVSTSVDASVPKLLMIERTTFGHALHDLFVHLERKGIDTCRVEARAEIAAGDLVQVEICLQCEPGLEPAELELLSGAERRHSLVPRDSGCGLSLALAARALARLGGRVEARDGGRSLLLELVLPLAAERRSSGARAERILELVETR